MIIYVIRRYYGEPDWYQVQVSRLKQRANSICGRVGEVSNRQTSAGTVRSKQKAQKKAFYLRGVGKQGRRWRGEQKGKR